MLIIWLQVFYCQGKILNPEKSDFLIETEHDSKMNQQFLRNHRNLYATAFQGVELGIIEEFIDIYRGDYEMFKYRIPKVKHLKDKAKIEDWIIPKFSVNLLPVLASDCIIKKIELFWALLEQWTNRIRSDQITRIGLDKFVYGPIRFYVSKSFDRIIVAVAKLIEIIWQLL